MGDGLGDVLEILVAPAALRADVQPDARRRGQHREDQDQDELRAENIPPELVCFLRLHNVALPSFSYLTSFISYIL